MNVYKVNDQTPIGHAGFCLFFFLFCSSPLFSLLFYYLV
jgi:hypothetical protein